MRRTKSLLTGTALSALLAAGAAQALDGTLESYRKARGVLDAAVAATGGAERINAIQTVLLQQAGTGYARNQSPEIQQPYFSAPTTRRAVLDLQRGWGLIENTSSFPGGFVFSNRQVFKGDEKFVVDLFNKTVQPNDQLQIVSLDAVHRLFPPLMLRKAMQRAGTLRWVGSSELDGRQQDVVSFTWDNGSLYTLYFDAATHLLTQYELLFPDALTGDALAELSFSGYGEREGLQVPEVVRQRVAGDILNEWRYTTVELNKPVDEALFTHPQGYEALAQQPPPAVEWVELAPDAYLVKNLGQGGYNMLVVAFEDHVVAMDAPLSQQVTAQAIAMIQDKLPGKPLRYAVLSHHHDDHAGGVGAFIAAGAKIVTASANAGYLGKMALSVDTLTPGSPAPNTRKLELEPVEGKRVFSDARNVLEIHDIGPSPHARNMLIAYLPKSKLVFQADQLFVPPVGSIPAGTETTAHFAKALETLGLAVEKIASVHGETGTMADLKAALAKRSSTNVVGQTP